MDGTDPNAAASLSAETRAMLERSLAHPHAVVRLKAIDAAARVGSSAVLPLLHRVLADVDPRVRQAALELFAQAIDAETASLAPAFFEGLAPAEQARIIELLRQRGDAAAETVLEGVLASSHSPTIQAALVAALGFAQRTDTRRRILEALVSEYNELRLSADAVIRANAAWLASEAANLALPVLERARHHQYPELQQSAVVWTDRIHAAQVRRVMVSSGVAPAMALVGTLRSHSALLRQAAAEMAARVRDDRTMPALVDVLHDSDGAVRRAAAVALISSDWIADTEEEHARALVALGRFEAAVDFGTAGIDALIAITCDAEPRVQAGAAAHLAKSVRALPALANLLNSPHRVVRTSAARALKQLEWVPPTPTQAIALAIADENWAHAVALGGAAVPALFAELKSSRADAPRSAAIAEALMSLCDADAAGALLRFCRDGEVAAVAMGALTHLLTIAVKQMSRQNLIELSKLEDVVQFKFSVDATYGQTVRSGFELISASQARALALQELAERGETP